MTRYDACAAYASGKVYWVGGVKSDLSDTLASVLVYDTTTQAWSTGTPLATSRGALGCAALDGLVYAVGGVSGASMTASAAVEAFNGSAWTTLASLPHARVGPGVTALPSSTNAGLSSRLVVAGGETAEWYATSRAHDPDPSVSVYIPSLSAWVDKAPMASPAFRHASAQVGATTYAFGGQGECTGTATSVDAACANTARSDVLAFADSAHPDLYLHVGAAYDSAGGTTAAATLTQAVELVVGAHAGSPPSGYTAAGALYDGAGAWGSLGAQAALQAEGAAVAGLGEDAVLVCGGISGGSATATCTLLDARARTVSTKASMPAARSYPLTAAVGSKVYVFGGKDSSGNAQGGLYVYSSGDNTWTDRTASVTDLSTGSAWASGSAPAMASGCAVEAGGLVYLLHGTGSGSSATAVFRVFDPVAMTVSSHTPPSGVPKASMFCAEAMGKVYVFGGADATVTANAGLLKGAAVFDPATGEGDSWGWGWGRRVGC